MASDNPYKPPAPRQLVQMLRIHAWSDHLDDDSRLFHEWSADVIEQLLDRAVSQAKLIEVIEASL